MDDKAIKKLEADLWEMADLLRAEAYSAVEKAARKIKRPYRPDTMKRSPKPRKCWPFPKR